MAEAPIETEAQRLGAEHAARLSRLIGVHFGFVWRLLRRIGTTEHEADFSAEQVFGAAAQRIGDIRSGSERAFLVSTALHVASRIKREQSDHPGPVSDSAPALEDLDEQQQAREILDVILQQMPLELRAVFVLHEVLELAGSEISELVGIPLGMVAERLAEAHEEFATHLEAGSDLAESLLIAARQERPKPGALEQTLRALGVSQGALNSESAPGAMSAPGARSESGRNQGSGYGLAIKWLAIGMLVGLALTGALYGFADALSLPRGAAAR